VKNAGSLLRALVVLSIALSTVMAVLLYQRTESYAWDSSVYIGLARSLLERGAYDFNFEPHTFYPPGLPLLLAAIASFSSLDFVVLVRWMAVAGGSALLVSYVLLRDHGRAIAAAACILVASAPQYFRLVTQTVGSDVPFFLASVSTLLLASRLSTCDVPWRRAWLSVLCALALVSAVLLRSVGIALVGGLSWWLVLSWWRRPGHRGDLVRRFALPLGAGIAAQGAWMVWTRAMRIASSAGSDAGYGGHLWLKDAHRHELGVASVGDIATRIADNAIRYSAILAETLLRRDWIDPVWFSPAVVVPAVLVVLGLGVRVWRRGTCAEWYFIAYVAIYLLWPYNEGLRRARLAPRPRLSLRGGRVGGKARA
jgi:hypothetical protein